MSRRFRQRGQAVPVASLPAEPADTDLDLEGVEGDEMDFPMEELREFLSADLFDVPADPAFKEGLREKLWELVQSGSFGYGKSRHG